MILIKRQMTALEVDLKHRDIKKPLTLNYFSPGCLTGKSVQTAWAGLAS